MRNWLLFSINLFLYQGAIAQNNSAVIPKPSVSKSIFRPKNGREFSRKGDVFVHWGYNFSWYAKSDLHFKGPGYNFTLNDVVAHDRPTKFGKKYFDPAQITIPQFNLHFGYFIKDNFSISLGWDHMKYVMDIPQVVKISGTINSSISDPAIPTGTYSGVYYNQDLKVNPEMLRFEHTDGFNYLSTDIERHDDIWVSKAKNSTLTLEIGAGLGVILPRTDVRLFEVGQNNYWNLAGYGVSAKTGLKYYFNKKLYLQNNLKIGWANLPNIHTTGRNAIDKADQQISYLENYTVLGFQF